MTTISHTIKIAATSLVLAACILMSVTSCNTETSGIDKNAKTLAGSIAGISPYFVKLTLDDSAIVRADGSDRFLLLITQNGNNQVEFSISAPENDDTQIVSDGKIVRLSIQSVTLKGKACDVSFEENTLLSMTDAKGYKFYVDGKISAHLENPQLNAIPTRAAPDHFDLDGEIRLEWKGAEGSHVLLVSDIKANLQ